MQSTRLFGTDGIRGKANDWPLTPEFVVRLGWAVGQVIQRDGRKPVVVLGQDTRESGEMIGSALSAGLLACSVDVIRLGVITTPGVACLTKRLEAGLGIVISASHNPYDENGIKFFGPDGFKLDEQTEQEIEQLSQSRELDHESTNSRTFGRVKGGANYRELYLQHLVGERSNRSFEGLRVVVDCANGAASRLAPECLSLVGAELVTVNASPTGTNINHRAGSEYVRRHPEDMASVIQQGDAKFGLAFDGDADRVVFVDEAGKIVDGDHMLGILALAMYRTDQLPSATVVTTQMRNSGLAHTLESAGIQLEETKVGDKYVVERMLEGQHPLGGEQAGHIILLKEGHTTGDGIRTALLLIDAYLESDAGSLSQLASSVRKVPQVIASAYVASKPELESIDLLSEQMEKTRSTLPGLLRMELRYSGTEPLFRAMLESTREHSEDDLAREASKICRVVQEAAGSPEAHLEILDCSRGGLLSSDEA